MVKKKKKEEEEKKSVTAIHGVHPEFLFAFKLI